MGTKVLLDYYNWLRSLSEEELISAWEDTTDEEEGYYTISEMAIADVNIPVRDVIEEKGLAEKVKEFDMRIIKMALKRGYAVGPGERYGGKEVSLKHWWWYLDLIAEKRYPAKLLPEHLKEIYLKEGGSSEETISG
ncbi:MAG: hypothetical protein RMI74_08505 [Thermodesulfobacterium sp.]|nr:hypothetical protein [Thermodesulfobacterium sp.]